MIYCDGFRPLVSATLGDAAATFAGRLARREFGRAGFVRTLRLSSWAEGGNSATYDVFIGRPLYGLTRNACDRGTTTGHNVTLTVTRL